MADTLGECEFRPARPAPGLQAIVERDLAVRSLADARLIVPIDNLWWLASITV
jgi:hypothetical protein